MKLLLFIGVFMLTHAASFSQENGAHAVPSFTLVDNKIVYSGSINVDPAITKETLFDNSQHWYKHNFESADNTLTVIKADSGKISGTGIIHIRHHDKHAEPYDIYFTIDVIVGKGTYQYKVYDIHSFADTVKFFYSDVYNEEQYPTPKPRWPKPNREAMLNKMNDSIEAMLEVLNVDMLHKVK